MQKSIYVAKHDIEIYTRARTISGLSLSQLISILINAYVNATIKEDKTE